MPDRTDQAPLAEGAALSEKDPKTRAGDASERALLLSVSFRARTRAPELRRTAAAAREAAMLRDEQPRAAVLDQASDPDAFSTRQAEFRELAQSAGATVVAELTQHRDRPDPATLVGSGKLDEIAGTAKATETDLVLVDHDLSPTQLRNLEAALPCPVVDRTQLILDIFARHARTREGQLQVELAQLEYMLPRLTGRGRAMSQLGGGIGTRGPGETQLETDRRRIARRLVHLKREIEGVRKVRAQQRQRRETAPTPTVALVGYTNAGKSTLFNLLTEAGVLASSRMFATLDPKLKPIQLPSRRRVVLSDTVGFIRDLPHTLVTSFRATLEEVERAEVLLHVQDAASPDAEGHRREVEGVLDELGVLAKRRIDVWNKGDLLGAEERLRLLATEGGVLLSAREGWGIEALLARVDEALTADPLEEAELAVPQAAGDVLALLDAEATVRERRYEGDEVRLAVTAPRSLLGRLRAYQAEPPD